MQKEEIYNLLLEQYGDFQMVIAIEELSELQKELTKYLRGKLNKSNLLEEYVDVTIMLEQIKILFKFEDCEIQKMKDTKIQRIEKRLFSKDL